MKVVKKYGRSWPLVKILKERVIENEVTHCWEWQGKLNQDGYARMRLNGRKQMCHRIAYEAFIGKIPPGVLVCHRCDNPRCINPQHLFLGTDKDNSLDCIRKGRRPRGSAMVNAKLTEGDVRFIRQHFKAKDPVYGGYALAKKYNVSPSTIFAAVHRRQWKSLQ